MGNDESLYDVYLRGYVGTENNRGERESAAAYALGVHHREIKAAPVQLRSVIRAVKDMTMVGGHG